MADVIIDLAKHHKPAVITPEEVWDMLVNLDKNTVLIITHVDNTYRVVEVNAQRFLINPYDF